MSKRILLVDDDPDHELLLEIAALDSGGRVVGRVGDVATLAAAVARTRPDIIVLDVWLADGVALDRLDEVRAAVGDLPILLWTHDPWVVRRYPEAVDLPVIDKLAPRSELLVQLAATA